MYVGFLTFMASSLSVLCRSSDGLLHRALPPFWGAMLQHCLFLDCIIALCWRNSLHLFSDVQCMSPPWRCLDCRSGSSSVTCGLDLALVAWTLSLLNSLRHVCAATVLVFFCRLSDCSIPFLFRQFEQQHRLPFCEKRCTLCACSFRSSHARFGSLFDFDQTIGYPGEGPTFHKGALWSLCTANVGSLKTSHVWKSNDDSLWCLQETRIGKNNIRASTKAVEEVGKSLFYGQLLTGIMRTDGVHTTMHGGTAILAPDTHTRAFTPEDDISGKYAMVFASKRVNAVWTQVTPTVRALVFSIYAKSGASICHDTFQENDQLLSDVFEIVAQFGDIPIIIAGDMQADPSSYPSIASAIHFHKWFDL